LGEKLQALRKTLEPITREIGLWFLVVGGRMQRRFLQNCWRRTEVFYLFIFDFPIEKIYSYAFTVGYPFACKTANRVAFQA
jgi:hypothetical protein